MLFSTWMNVHCTAHWFTSSHNQYQYNKTCVLVQVHRKILRTLSGQILQVKIYLRVHILSTILVHYYTTILYEYVFIWWIHSMNKMGVISIIASTRFILYMCTSRPPMLRLSQNITCLSSPPIQIITLLIMLLAVSLNNNLTKEKGPLCLLI